MTCPTCGCTTHTPPQTWKATCAVCHTVKYPYCTEQPGDGWTCALCLLGSPRQAAGRKREAKRLQKAPLVPGRAQGGVLATPPPSHPSPPPTKARRG